MAAVPHDIDTVYELVQEEFNVIDERLGQNGKRRMHIVEIPRLERDLDLIHDIVAITCNAGMGAWIHYHYEEPG